MSTIESYGICYTTAIYAFNNIKVYNVDASDNHLKKLDLTETDAKIEIHFVENSNEFQFKLSSFSYENSNERIFLNQNLNEIEFNFKNDNISKKIEIKIKRNIINKFYYAIEFVKQDDYQEFLNGLDYLKDILSGSNISKQIMNNDQEMTDQIEGNNDDYTVTPKGYNLYIYF